MKGNVWFVGCIAAAGLLSFLLGLCLEERAFAVEGVRTYKVGEFDISLLSEGQSDGNNSNLIGADEEMMKKYVPNGTYPTAVNTFLIRTPDRLVLVDTGFGRELFKNMKSLGVEAEQIDAVLLTHMHGDHIGGLLVDGKAAFPKAKLYLAQQEHDYWTNEEIMKTFPENRQGGFKNSQAAIAAYSAAVELFSPTGLGAGSELLPGVTPAAAFGHTPGHTVYMVESGTEKLLIWGDLTHAMAIQMPVPEVAMTYDVDPEMAVASRLAVLKYVSENKIPVAGMHIPHPAVGSVAPSNGGYAFEPLP